MKVVIQNFFGKAAWAQSNEVLDKVKKAAEGDSAKGIQGFWKPISQEGGLVQIAEFIGLLLNYLLGFLGVIFLLLTIYAGFKWMFARGNEEEVQKAQRIMIHSAQGIIIVIIAFAVVNFVATVISGLNVIQ